MGAGGPEQALGESTDRQTELEINLLPGTQYSQLGSILPPLEGEGSFTEVNWFQKKANNTTHPKHNGEGVLDDRRT